MTKKTSKLSTLIDKYRGQGGWVRYIIRGGKVVPEILATGAEQHEKVMDLATPDEQYNLDKHRILPARILAEHNFIRVEDIGSYLEKGEARQKDVAAAEAPQEIHVRPVGYVLFDFSSNTIPLINGAPMVSQERGELVRWIRNQQFATNAGKNTDLSENHLGGHALGVKTLVDTHSKQWTHMLDANKADIYDVPVE